MKKKLTMVVSLLLVMALSIGGTVAYLTDKTDAIKNTFTIGNVKIDLTETDVENNETPLANSYKMIPGNEIAKDPKVTVEAGSEACWLFVKIEKSKDFDTYITSAIADGWTQLSGVDGVYYIDQAAVTADTPYSVLKGDKVTVNTAVTQAMMDAIADKTVAEPTMTITAYAIQKAGFTTVEAAWAEVSK